jgi:hypothetical protein
MSDLILVETVDSVISNINEDDKTYNIDYDINDRLRFLQNKYKDYEIKIINNFIQSKKNGNKRFRESCINFDCIKQPSFCKEDETKETHCKDCSKLAEDDMESIYKRKCIVCKEHQPSFCIEG